MKKRYKNYLIKVILLSLTTLLPQVVYAFENKKINNILTESTFFVEQPVLAENIETLFVYISTEKHEQKTKLMLEKIAKNTGNNNAIMFIGSQTNNIDKYLSLISCDLYGKTNPIIVLERKIEPRRCYYYYPENIVDINSMLNRYVEYIKNGNNGSVFYKSKVQEIIRLYSKDKNLELGNSAIESIEYLFGLAFDSLNKE